MIKKVIDVSKWNAITNFSTIHEKVDGVIVRIGFRGNVKPTLISDPRYIPYMVELNKYNNPLGAYFMTSAITEDEAKEEANFFIDCIEQTGVKLSIPVFVKTDWTISTHDGRSDLLDKELRTNVIIAFVKECEKRGHVCGIAATYKWFKEQLCLDKLEPYGKWVTDKADNSSLSEFGSSLMIKTVNDKFEVKGISGYVTISELKMYNTVHEDIKKKPEKKKVKEPKVEEIVIPEVVKEKSVKKEPKKKEYKLGGKIKLNNSNLYSSSISSTVVDVLSGNFYVTNDKILRGRIRISDKKNGEVIGWIDTE